MADTKLSALATATTVDWLYGEVGGASKKIAPAIQTIRVPLSSADILALNASPITVVDAPGTNKVIIPLAWFINSTFGATAYTGSTQPDFFHGASRFFFCAGTELKQLANAARAGNAGSVDVSAYNEPVLFTTSSGELDDGDGSAIIGMAYIVVDAS